jgi:hypothetical protein
LEYEIAVDLRKPVFVFIAADDCLFDHPTDQPDELRLLQIEHLRRLKASDRTRMEFRSREHLTDQVRVMRFDPNRPARRRAVVGALAVVGLALAVFSWPGRDGRRDVAPTPASSGKAAYAAEPGRDGGHTVIPTPALSCELSVRVWSPGTEGKRGWKVEDAGALPVLAGEQVHLEARLSRPAYAYLLWLDGQGRVASLYPWLDTGFKTRRAPKPDAVFHSPDEIDKGWPMAGPPGLETALLLARSTPLPPETDLAMLIGRLAPSRLRDPLEVAVIGFDRGQPAAVLSKGEHRGLGAEAEQIDDPLLELMEKLRKHFEVIRAVRFAYQGE